LSEAVRRDPAEPGRWCDLADAMLKAGRADEARRYMSTALELGARIPTVYQRAANVSFAIGDTNQAMAHASRVLALTSAYDDAVFGEYLQRRLPLAAVLAGGLPREPRAFQEFLRFLIRNENDSDAAVAWRELLAHNYADDRLAREYVNFVYAQGRHEDAARGWAQYLGDRGNGYLESNWMFNGGFESELSGTPYDWTIESSNGDVEATLDPAVARAGHQSLRLRFGGKENVEYARTSQSVFVTPGVYRFEAFVRADGVTTDQGIRFEIFDPAGAERKVVRTEQVVGSTDWKRVEQVVPVSPGTHLLMVRVVRLRSLKFDNQIAGTAWIDDVRIQRLQ
jgi:tetratricopeptide (TPR) repeat protein